MKIAKIAHFIGKFGLPWGRLFDDKPGVVEVLFVVSEG